MYKKLIEKIDYASHKDKTSEIIEMLMCEVKNSNHNLYCHIEEEMYEMVYGKKISEEMADRWVQNMEPVGKHWTIDETTSVMKNENINFDPIEFFVVMNMIYNDYYNIVKDDDELTIKLSKDWLDDVDAKSNKLYEYWKYVIKRD